MCTFVEITTKNMQQYLDKILALQDVVCQNLKTLGKEDWFFSSSKEEIVEHINSEESIVSLIETDSNIASVCFLTFNHSTYNDLTFYIRNSAIYRESVLSTYNMITLISTYISNVKTYCSLKEDGTLNGDLLRKAFEKSDANDFFEDDPLRKELANILVSHDILTDFGYPWLVSADLPMYFSDNAKTISAEYDKFISLFNYKYVYSIDKLPAFAVNLTDSCVGRLDTYFVNPTFQNQGFTTTLVNQTVNLALKRKSDIKTVTSTCHPDNHTSQHILENMKFEKFFTVERHKGVLRDVMFKLI